MVNIVCYKLARLAILQIRQIPCATAALVSHLWISEYDKLKPNLLSISIKNFEEKWWCNWTPNPIWSGCIWTFGLAACIIAWPIEAILTSASKVLKSLSLLNSKKMTTKVKQLLHQLYTPNPNLEIYRNTCTFIFSGSSVWNSLPSYIQNSTYIQHFKSQYWHDKPILIQW